MAVALTKKFIIARSCSMVSPVSVFSNTYSYCFKSSVFSHLVTRNYAADSSSGSKKSKMATAASGRIKEYPVETDTHKLVTYCCGLNYFQNSEEVKLKPDSEYPDWLYTVDIGQSKSLEELDPTSKEYWLKVRRLARKRKNQLHWVRVKVLKKF